MTPPADARRFQVLIETWRARLTPEGWHDESAESCADDLEAELAAVSSSQTWQPIQVAFYALADIAESKDMTFTTARNKARRIMRELRPVVEAIESQAAPPASEPDK